MNSIRGFSIKCCLERFVGVSIGKTFTFAFYLVNGAFVGFFIDSERMEAWHP